MAWDLAAYGIMTASLTIAAAFVIGIVQICRSLRRLDTALGRLGKETEASLLQCKELAEEAKETIAASRQSLQGFSSLAEGARALGEAAQSTAQGIAKATALCRERLASIIPASTEHCDHNKASGNSDLSEISRILWLLWKKRRSENEPNFDCSRHSGLGADPSQGE
ncbi:hypothetical protein [Cohnella sp.]|uniref:hypothetical protein n=1 Tax=Cohnella sp. TaxID=1883426 RepID=UPI003566410A